MDEGSKQHTNTPVRLRQRAPYRHMSSVSRVAPPRMRAATSGKNQRRLARGFSITQGRPSLFRMAMRRRLNKACRLPSLTLF